MTFSDLGNETENLGIVIMENVYIMCRCYHRRGVSQFNILFKFASLTFVMVLRFIVRLVTLTYHCNPD